MFCGSLATFRGLVLCASAYSAEPQFAAPQRPFALQKAASPDTAADRLLGPCLTPWQRGWAWIRSPAAAAPDDASRIWLLYGKGAPEAPSGLVWRKAPKYSACAGSRVILPEHADAGFHLDVEGLLRDWSQATPEALRRQIIFRLGLDSIGQADGIITVTPTAVLCRTTLAWPEPQRGLVTAFGPAIVVRRPSQVPAAAPAYLAACMSPGRAWRELEAYAGGLWPLESTLVGTQIAAWEQTNRRRVVQDLLGLHAQLWSAFVPPGGSPANTIAVLPIANAPGMLDFLQWALNLVRPFAPHVTATSSKMDGQSVWVVRGLLKPMGLPIEEVFVLPIKGALVIGTDALGLKRFARQRWGLGMPAPAVTNPSTTPTAVLFGAVQHRWGYTQKNLLGKVRGAGLPAWTRRMLHEGQTQGYLQSMSQGWRSCTRSVFDERQDTFRGENPLGGVP